MSRIRHYPVNDLFYTLAFEESIKTLASNTLNFDSPDVFEIIEIFNISLFFKDEKMLNEHGKEILKNNRNYLSPLMKAQNLYFKGIDNSKIENDFICLQDHLSSDESYSPADYFEVLSSNIDFTTCQNDIGETCLKYVPLWVLIENKQFVIAFHSLIKNFMLNHAESFGLFVENYDDASSKRVYYFPSFTDDEIDSLIEGYIASNECKPKALELLLLHRDSPNSYRIKRKTRLAASKKLEKLQKDITSDKSMFSIPFSFDCGFVVSPSQKELVTASNLKGKSILSFSEAFFKEATTWNQVLQRAIDSGILVNQLDSISGIYNPFKENTISKLFETIHANQYGSQTYHYLSGINQTFFDFLYSNFRQVNKPFEDLITWFIDEKINPLIKKAKLDLTPVKDDNFQIKCEHVFNQISSLLLQYRIFVEEGEITPDLIEETKDSLPIGDLPSLVKDKYYELNTNSDDARNIMFLLFNDQSGISYISRELYADNFYNLITNKEVSYDAYKGGLKTKIDYLVNRSIVKIDNGILRFLNFETSFVWKFIYDNLFIPSYLVDDEVIRTLERYCDKKVFRKYSKLFSSAESDYLDYILNNSKFSNALALRNHYEHGQSFCYSDKQHHDNYLIGLRTLLIILIKIHKDIFESMQNPTRE